MINFLLAQWFCLQNWIIKIWFYIRYLMGQGNDYHKWIPCFSFYSESFSDGQWRKTDKPFEYESLFTQIYGKFYVKAEFGGLIADIWPAIWLYAEKSLADVQAGNSDHPYYYEIDIELMKTEFVCSMWANDHGGQNHPDTIHIRSSFRCRKLWRKLQSEFHLFLIDWSKDWIKFYINGLLCAKIKNKIHEPMKIICKKIEMTKTIVQSNN